MPTSATLSFYTKHCRDVVSKPLISQIFCAPWYFINCELLCAQNVSHCSTWQWNSSPDFQHANIFSSSWDFWEDAFRAGDRSRCWTLCRVVPLAKRSLRPLSNMLPYNISHVWSTLENNVVEIGIVLICQESVFGADASELARPYPLIPFGWAQGFENALKTGQL